MSDYRGRGLRERIIRKGPAIAAIIGSYGACVLPVAMAAQTYPARPVRLVTAEVGAAGDYSARLLAPGLSEVFGQQFIVDNRGGSGVIPFEIVARAPPDGHTLLVFGSAVWLLPLLQNVPYNPVTDYAPITLAVTTPLLVVVNPAVPVKSIRELVALARAKPGELNYSSGISGSATHLPAELFKFMTGVNIVRVAYKGGGPALNALLGGEVQVMFATSSGAAPQVAAGRLRALAVTSARPSALFPDLPTVAASGLPGYDAASIMVVFAPAKTPAALIGILNREIVRLLNKPDLRERYSRAGAEVVASTPEQLAATMKSDMIMMEKVIKAAGIRAQ
jgi:tripartite-type tricarboxylate transporter receptor subunit TctC